MENEGNVLYHIKSFAIHFISVILYYPAWLQVLVSLRGSRYSFAEG